MQETYNIYCDESCHLEHDGAKSMVLGAVWCRTSSARRIAERIRAIKGEFGISSTLEVKWIKVSPAKLAFYQRLIEYFFAEQEISFRALIVPDKSVLRHEDFRQTHDDWYYRMYFDMLKIIIRKPHAYRIFIDVKDTCGTTKVRKLHEVLCRNIHDLKRQVVRHAQQVRSHEVEQMQLADLLIGCLSYASRGLSGPAKSALVKQFGESIGQDPAESTPRSMRKVNILRWIPGGV